MGYLRKKNGIDIYGPYTSTINDGGLNISVGTTETPLTTLVIPANTFVTGDCINIISRIVKTSTAGVSAIRMRIGTNGSPLSNPLVASYTATTNTDTMIPIFRNLSFYSGSTNYVIDPTFSMPFDSTLSSTVTTVSIDWGVQNLLTISGINNSGSDTMNCMFIKTKVL